MPPIVALAICTGFVIFILRVEGRGEGRPTLGFVLATTWLLYCASRPIIYWMGGLGVGSVESGSMVDRVFSLGLMTAGILVLARRRFDTGRFVRENSWLISLFLLMAASIFWSEYPETSAKRWFRALGSIIMAGVVMTEPNPKRALIRMLRICAYILLPYSLMLVKYYPHLGVAYNHWSGDLTWVGVCTQKNGLGRLCMVCAFVLIWDALKRKREGGAWIGGIEGRVDLFILVLASFLILGGGRVSKLSATSVGVLLVGCIFVIWMGGKQGHLEYLRSALNGIFVVVVVTITVHNLFLLNSPLALVTGLFGRDSSFTGRTDIWEPLLEAGSKAPLLGYGYGSFWIDPPTTIPVNQAHNGYLDLFLALGFLGVLTLGLYLFQTFKLLKENLEIDFQWACFGIAFVMMVLLHNLAESSVVRGTSHLWTLLVYVSCVASRRFEAANLETQALDLGDSDDPR